MTLYQTPKPKKDRNALISGVIALAVLCCGGGLVAALTDDNKPTSPSAVSASPFRAAELPPPKSSSEPAPEVETATAASPTPEQAVKLSPSRSIKPNPTKPPTPKRTTAPPKTSKPKPKATTESVTQGVHPDSFCSRQGARGVSKTGKPMVCTTTPTDPRKRWRAA